ncbi:MAG: hypothetical protein ACFHWX_02330 [Bacteroidota bacterium]
MKKLAFVACLCMLSFSLFGQLPKTLSFQGYLTNSNGEPITNSALELSFSLHTQKTGGSMVWGPEIHQVNVDKGIFNTILGASQITAVPLDFGGSLTFDQKYFLEIVIDPSGTPETLTRIELTSSMFSLSTLNATNITSGTLSGALLDAVAASKITGSLAVANGGTGATDAAGARTNLGVALGTDVQAYDTDLADLADGELSGNKVGTGIDAENITTNTLALTNGGTGASNAATARDNLGLAIGSNVQAYDADLTTYAGISPGTDVQTFLGSANNSVARSNLGLAIGSDVQAFDADLTTYAGIPPSSDIQAFLSSSNASNARSILGVTIGTDVQAFDADLTSFATVSPSADILELLGSTNYSTARTNLGLAIGTNVQAYNANLDTYGGITPSANVQTMLGSVNNAAIRGNIGLGTIAIQNANSVTISGGNVTGITDLAIEDGGTGASTAAAARINLGLQIGSDVQGHIDLLTEFSSLFGSYANGNFIVGNGTAWVVESGATARASLGAQAADADLADLADGSLTGTKVDPDFGSQDIATTGGLDVGGFTTLGDDASAPAIKMKTLTGTSSSSEGGATEIAHGLTLENIISVSVILEISSTQFLPPGFSNSAGVEYNWFIDTDGIHVQNHPTESENILSKPFKILITYVQP